MDKSFVKLSNLVDDEFTVERVYEPKWKLWSQGESRMLVSESPQKGYRKVYGVVTDKGIIDLGAGQLGNLLEGVAYNGKADIINRTFTVKSNGKTGMEIRYWLNPKPDREADNQSAEMDF